MDPDCGEKIRVIIRVRPLTQKEQMDSDVVAWECTDQHTIVSKNLTHERPIVPFKFDKVFDPTCSTRKVYEEGVRDIVISALNGINVTIFAYGQSSSGKTFTMRGITGNAIKDIYEHIKNTRERDFILKFSAMEIYNEHVRDLLNYQLGALQVLNDPAKGIIVENLTENTVDDEQHLRNLIGTCEARRKVGATALNDKSSRSHQIIRLTIESSPREKSGCPRFFLASLNLADLAGSVHVSQTNAKGSKLREGKHVNLSLLALKNVITKLSCARRSDYIPYRDSKLTRILQHALGGNARTSIICTVSPALSHVEESRDTLSFATSAKKVTNKAQLNLVVSMEKLVEHLQEKIAELEAGQKSQEPSCCSQLRALLLERDLKIKQLEKEICKLEKEICKLEKDEYVLEIENNELKRKRDLTPSQLELEESRAHQKLKMDNAEVFLLGGKMADLDVRRAEVLGNAAKIIQRQIRTYIARKEFISLREAAIQLQSFWRVKVASLNQKSRMAGRHHSRWTIEDHMKAEQHILELLMSRGIGEYVEQRMIIKELRRHGINVFLLGTILSRLDGKFLGNYVFKRKKIYTRYYCCIKK